MKKTFLFLPFMLIGCHGLALADSFCPTPKEFEALPAPSLSDRFFVASHIYAAVKYRFAHMRSLGNSYDLDKTYHDYLDDIATVATRVDFDRKTAKFFATLKNGHTRFLDKLASCHYSLPFKVDFIEGKWLVTHSWLSTLPVGAEIRSINSRDFSQWADQQVAFISDSSVRSQRHLLSSPGYGMWLWPQHFTFTVQKPGEKSQSLVVDRNAPNAYGLKPTFKGLYKPASGITVIKETSHIVRITVSDFVDPHNENKMIDIVKKYQKSPVILFDVRQSEGGGTPIQLIRSLLEKPTYDEIALTPQHIAVNDAYNDLDIPDAPSYSNTWMRFAGGLITPKPLYHGKVFILSDGGCPSACEDFLMLMKSSKRAVILGEPSWGIFGVRSGEVLPQQHMEFGVGAINIQWPDGTEAEGKGIIPDVSIPLTQEELLAGKDAVLEKSIKYINTVMKEDHHEQ